VKEFDEDAPLHTPASALLGTFVLFLCGALFMYVLQATG
jgi:hypothetical protein